MSALYPLLSDMYPAFYVYHWKSVGIAAGFFHALRMREGA